MNCLRAAWRAYTRTYLSLGIIELWFSDEHWSKQLVLKTFVSWWLEFLWNGHQTIHIIPNASTVCTQCRSFWISQGNVFHSNFQCLSDFYCALYRRWRYQRFAVWVLGTLEGLRVLWLLTNVQTSRSLSSTSHSPELINGTQTNCLFLRWASQLTVLGCNYCLHWIWKVRLGNLQFNFIPWMSLLCGYLHLSQILALLSFS